MSAVASLPSQMIAMENAILEEQLRMDMTNSQFLNKIVHVDDENGNNDYDFSDEEYAGQLAIVEVHCRCYF
jgi:hypothetical protein